MLRTNFIITLRRLTKQKGFALINVFGFVVAVTAAMLIFQYVHFETSYDTFWEDSDRIHRVVTEFQHDGEDATFSAGTMPPLTDLILEIAPEVQHITRVHQQEPKENVLTYVNTSTGRQSIFEEDKVYFTDPDFFKVFSFEILDGEQQGILDGPQKMVISSSLAERFFKEENPVGKTIHVSGDSTIAFTVTGVFEDAPTNSHFKPSVLLSLETKVNQHPSWNIYNHWYWRAFLTYMKVDEGIDISALEARIESNLQLQRKSYYEQRGDRVSVALQSLADIHLNSTRDGEFELGGNASVNKFLLIIALCILLLAAVNYSNLSTSQALTRAKEVGIRKVVGANKNQLVLQFLIEAILIMFTAMLISLVLFPLLLPFFNQLIGMELTASLFMESYFWWSVLASTFIVGFISGIYPAFIMSTYKSSQVLKGKFEKGEKGILLKKGIVIFQFSVSLILLIGTLGTQNFIETLQKRDLGIDIKQVLLVKTPKERGETYVSKVDLLRSQAEQLNGVVSTSITTALPGGYESWHRRVQVVGRGLERNTGPLISIVHSSRDFHDLFGLDLLVGRGFGTNLSNEMDLVVLNDEAAKLLEFESLDDAINQQIKFMYDPRTELQKRVIGVVSSYQHYAYNTEKLPMVYILSRSVNAPWSEEHFAFDVEASNVRETIDKIGEEYARIFPETPFTYFFLDDHFNQQFASEQRFSDIFSYFSILAILISCFGMLALTAYHVIRKRKEIAIRKVLGASIIQMLNLLFSNHFKLIGIASLLAIPIAYVGISKWIANFEIQLPIPLWIIILPVIGIIFVTLFLSLYHILKASRENPAEVLSEE